MIKSTVKLDDLIKLLYSARDVYLSLQTCNTLKSVYIPITAYYVIKAIENEDRDSCFIVGKREVSNGDFILYVG